MLDQTSTTEDAVKEQPLTIAGKQLRQVVEKMERLAADKKDIAKLEKDCLSEAKDNGLMITVIRKIIKIRATDPDKRAEEDAQMEIYMRELGM